jgi:galactose mutarotase-like enzyme
MDTLFHLNNGNAHAQINLANGQLVSFTVQGIEFIHPGGMPDYQGPGWKNSEIVCFPLFGPAKDEHVEVNGKTYRLGQHGISRHTGIVPFVVATPALNEASVRLVQTFYGGNALNPGTGPGPTAFSWLPYSLEKTFEITDQDLTCTLTVRNEGDVSMPYMIGWHPAFSMFGRAHHGEFFRGKKDANIPSLHLASLDEVIIASQDPVRKAYQIPDCAAVVYFDHVADKGISVTSKGLPHTFLWSPSEDAKMFCIESVSQLPDPNGEGYFADPTRFELLKPFEKKSYTVRLQPLL